MKKWAVLFVLVSGLSAQSLQENAVNAVNTLAPPLSTLMVGEHLATANTLGSLPHFRVGFGVNLTKITIQNPATGDAQDAWAPLPFLMADVGFFPGMSLTPLITGVGSMDLLAKFSIFPGLENASNYIKSVPPFWALGARIGLIKDHLWSPAAAITVLYGNFSPLELQGGDPTGDSVFVKTGIKATGFYLEISKDLMLLTPYLGLGWIKSNPTAEYKTNANDDYTALERIESSSPFRTDLGVELSFIPLIKIYVEAILTKGSTVFSFGLRAGI